MGLRINTNVLSITAQRNLQTNSKAFGQALNRLASGSRINRAGDDAAGLAISEGLQGQVRGVQQAIRNSNDALGFLNTAEGALSELTNITQRLRELSIQAANGTLGAADRGFLNDEKNQLIAEFQRIASQTDFNGTKLLNGTFSTTDLQVGTFKGQTIQFNIGDARASSLGAVATVSGAQNNISASSAVTINGDILSASVAADDTLSSAGNAYSSIAQAAAINDKSGITGVTADVLDTEVTLYNADFGAFSGTLSTDDFVINGVSITGAVTDVSSFIDAINDNSNSTGVQAELAEGSSTDIRLFASDGRNIKIDFTTQASTSDLSASIQHVFTHANNFGTVSTLFTTGETLSTAGENLRTGAIKLTSADAITITSGGSTALGFSDTSVAVDENTAINSIDLTTQDNAADALAIVDQSLSQLNELRASLGAVQNRLDSTVRNLSITLENVSSARSQIRDTDIAAETAELTRAQILQQAGVSVLGQANASSQIALGLLNF